MISTKHLMSAASLIALVLPSVSLAQTAYTVDPQTGNYVPIRDGALVGDPDANVANPNRLGNRLSPRNAKAAAPSSRLSTRSVATVARPIPIPDDGLTPSQRMAAHAANNGRVAPVLLTDSDGQKQMTTSEGLVSLGGMETYLSPTQKHAANAASGNQYPNAKPDWWPK